MKRPIPILVIAMFAALVVFPTVAHAQWVTDGALVITSYTGDNQGDGGVGYDPNSISVSGDINKVPTDGKTYTNRGTAAYKQSHKWSGLGSPTSLKVNASGSVEGNATYQSPQTSASSSAGLGGDLYKTGSCGTSQVSPTTFSAPVTKLITKVADSSGKASISITASVTLTAARTSGGAVATGTAKASLGAPQ